MSSTCIHAYLILVMFVLSPGCSDKVTSEPPSSLIDTTKPDLKTDVACWLTSPAGNILFQPLGQSLVFSSTTTQHPVIEVDTTKTYQTIDGFGNSLTGGSALLIHKMDADSRTNLLKELLVQMVKILV